MTAAAPGARATQPSVEEPIRAAEVVGALSLATDLGTGQPLEHALRTAVIAIRLGELAGAHDLGRVGVSNSIWEKPGGLGFGEWERVRLHPHFTERAASSQPG